MRFRSDDRPAALLALASPLLILLALVGLLHRTGTARWEALPALLIGSGLLLTSVHHRRRRRKELLRSLRQHTRESMPSAIPEPLASAAAKQGTAADQVKQDVVDHGGQHR